MQIPIRRNHCRARPVNSDTVFPPGNGERKIPERDCEDKPILPCNKDQ